MIKRWRVQYVPYDEALALAKRRGYIEDSLESLWDFIQPDDAEVTTGEFTTFRDAVLRATEVVPSDTFGEVRVIEQQLKRTLDRIMQWEDVRYWLIYNDTKRSDLSSKHPDGEYESLSDDI